MEDGIVVGDETRLRQIITNLARYVFSYGVRLFSLTDFIHSNACKFTAAGGKLTIATKLIIPERYTRGEDDEDEDGLDLDRDLESGIDVDEKDADADADAGVNGDAAEGGRKDAFHRLSKNHLNQHNVLHAKPAPPLEWIVVRIEVTDTGCGIRPKDMVQSKLFCESSELFSSHYFDMLTCGRTSCVQPDRARPTAGWKGDRAGAGTCAPDCEAEWWAVGGAVEGRGGVDILGRAP